MGQPAAGRHQHRAEVPARTAGAARARAARAAVAAVAAACCIAPSAPVGVGDTALAWFTFDAGAANAAAAAAGLTPGAGHGVVVGAVRAAPGVSGAAFAFDGGTARVVADVDVSEDTHPEVTLGAWINVDGLNRGSPSLDRYR